MATRTILGLLPQLRIKGNKKIGKAFFITNELSLRITPQGIRDRTTFSPVGLDILGEFYYKDIKNSEWSIACDYKDPAYPYSNDNNLVMQRDSNLKQARETMWRFSILAGLKTRKNLFPTYRILANQDGTDAFLEAKPRSAEEFQSHVSYDELDELKRLLPVFNSSLGVETKTKYRYFRAIGLLRQAFLERFEDGKLILLMASLESVFNESKTEVTHKIATRVSCFLKSEYTDRRRLQRKVLDAYNVRSLIVHGQVDYRGKDYLKSPKEESDREKISSLTRFMMDLVCDALLKFIDPSPDEFERAFSSEKKYSSFVKSLDLGKYPLEENGPT